MDATNAVIDWAAILERFEGDGELFWDVASLFLQDCPKKVSVMYDALTCGDCGTLERIAHSLKGAVGNFGAAGAVSAAKRLEDLARARDLERARVACADLEAEISRLTSALEGASLGCCGDGIGAADALGVP